MKKYIFLSLLIHIGIGAVLISGSGASVSEWTQNLLNRFNADQPIEPVIEEPVIEKQEKSLEEESIQKEPLQKAVARKKKKLKKTVGQQLKKKISVVQSEKTVQKTAPAAEPTAEKKLPREKDTENSNTEKTVQKTAPAAEPTAEKKLPREKDTENSNTEKTVQKNPVDSSEIHQIPEVQYNPAENLTAVEQERADSPLGNSEIPTTQEEDVSEFITVEEAEWTESRDFEEINTDPQALKNIIKEEDPAEIKNSRLLAPAPGNPSWVYPQRAKENKNEGSVFLQYFVDDTGFVDKIKLLKSSGYSILDNEALRIMARQRYQPGQSGWYRHRVDFKLKNM